MINRNPYYDAPDKDGGTTTLEEVKPLGGKPEKADDDTALIDELIGDKDILDMDEQESSEEEEKPEEIELEEPEEEQELVTVENQRGIDLKKIKEKYPEFAKTNEFRELRNAYHREGQLSEIFPTIEDAREAAQDKETFDKLNNDLVNRGDSSSLISAIKEANPQNFKKIAVEFLDEIAKVDKDTYTEAITPVVRRLAKQIYATGQRHLKRDPESYEGKALVATARNIMQYAFDDADEIEKDEPVRQTQPSEKEKELQNRENAIKQEKFNNAYRIAFTTAMHNLDKQILNGLDPDNRFNDFTRDTLLEKIRYDVTTQIDKDTIHGKRMHSLWKRAEATGYSRESLSSIVSAYLERARPIIPVVRNRFRSIAIKGRQAANDDGEDMREKGPKIVSRGVAGKRAPSDGKVNLKVADPKKIDYSKTTDQDIFEGRVKLKG